MMKKIIIGISVVIGIIALMGIAVWTQKMDEDSGFGGKSEEVTVVTIEPQKITSQIVVTGVVKEGVRQDIRVKDVLEVSQVYTKKGEYVSKGERLFEINIQPLEDELAKLKLSQEREYLQLSRLSSESNVSNTESVKIGNELSRIAYETAEKDLRNQEEEYKKHQELYEGGVISEAELNNVKTRLDNAKAGVDNAKLSLDQSKATLREIQSTQANTSKAKDYNIRAQRLALESMEIDIQNLEERIQDYKKIGVADMDGVIAHMEMKEGDNLNPQEIAVSIVSKDKLLVEAYVREYDIRDIREGQNVLLTGDAIDDKVDVGGVVSYIAPVATKAVINGRETTSVLVEVTIEKGIEEVKPGYTLECDIITHENDQALVISYDMFGLDKKGEKMVYVVNEDQVIEERVVEVGVTSDFDAEIVSGLSVGEQVVINPSFLLKEGV